MVDVTWHKSLNRKFREKKNLFVKKLKRREKGMTKWRFKLEMWMMVTVGEDMVGIFRSYFDELLNLDNGRQHNNYQMQKSQG